MKSVLNQKFTVTIELADVDLSQVTPPYNPFIFVNGRSREVHLVNYAPTDKADKSFFNTSDDMSNIDEGIYYITRYGEEVDIMPFAINLPILDFSIPTEGVKIYDTYPDFIGWVKSNFSVAKSGFISISLISVAKRSKVDKRTIISANLSSLTPFCPRVP